MPLLPRPITRAAKVGALCGAALVLATPPAMAVVTTTPFTNSVTFSSDGASDTIDVSCLGGQLKLNFGADIMACTAVETITVNGGDGTDTVDLSDLLASDLPNLVGTDISGDGGPDNIKGSFASDVVEADTTDTVQAFGGNDFITGGDSVFGGDGNDLLKETQRSANGGSGDDRIAQPGQGPFDGGEGHDTLELEFGEVVIPISVNFVISDSVMRLEVPGSGVADFPSVSIETYDFVLPPNGSHSWNSSAYSGSSLLMGAPTGDTVVAGPGDDRLAGQGGNDSITAGGGTDIVLGGAGNDVVNVRDGQLDKVDCGDGTDSVVADAADLVTGCESVQLPPVPPPPPPPAPVVPDTGKVKGPKTVEQGVKAKFTFKSPTAGATFQCKVDKKAWKACKSPHKVATKNLKASKDGTKHVLKVRAVLAGVVDPSPSKKTFKVTKPD